eukprot:CAMPEP_0179056846 /NCGR_PEP_ID=MMETSP0796-20121207/24024_1 /TAXON_ID=73915 /ORGANISM="Pyrodinium bahamense, Strain pbaha01" /LENGTH=139 /DNA_ID=CAMNT_0020753537 /DNA_START=222 /DNA_END=639 /DNA_ORIENTATION=-
MPLPLEGERTLGGHKVDEHVPFRPPLGEAEWEVEEVEGSVWTPLEQQAFLGVAAWTLDPRWQAAARDRAASADHALLPAPAPGPARPLGPATSAQERCWAGELWSRNRRSDCSSAFSFAASSKSSCSTAKSLRIAKEAV